MLCGRIASSLTRIRPSVGLEQLDRQDAGDVELAGDRQRDLLRLRGQRPRRGRARARSTSQQIPSVCTDWPRPGRPRPARSASAPPARTARAGSRPSPRRAPATPRRGGREGRLALGGASATTQTPLPSYPPRVVLSTAGKPERRRDRRPREVDQRRCRGQGTPERGQPLPHHALVLRVHQRVRSGTDTRRPSAASARRCAVGTCSWSKVTTVQPVGDAPAARRGRGSRRPRGRGPPGRRRRPRPRPAAAAAAPARRPACAIIRASWPPPITASTGALEVVGAWSDTPVRLVAATGS